MDAPVKGKQSCKNDREKLATHTQKSNNSDNETNSTYRYIVVIVVKFQVVSGQSHVDWLG